jgi:uncharacterized protein YjiK
MKSKIAVGLLGLFFLSFVSEKIKPVKITPIDSFPIQVQEPSDLIYSPISQTFFVASDNGYLAEIDKKGNLLQKSEVFGIDFEGICLHNNQIIAVDETPRMFYRLERDFSVIHQKRINYSGGRNKGFESIAFHPLKKTFLTATEKDPSILFELDTLFNVLGEKRLPFRIGDISALAYHENFLWILSDEDRTLYKCHIENFSLQKSFLLPIINPEGLAFDEKGDLYICSDDMEKMYVFSKDVIK